MRPWVHNTIRQPNLNTFEFFPMHLTHPHFHDFAFWILDPCVFLYRKTREKVSRQNIEIDHFFPPKFNLTIWSVSVPKMAHGPPPIGGPGPKFKSLIISFFCFFFNFFIIMVKYILLL
jgi:hypothetical protein